MSRPSILFFAKTHHNVIAYEDVLARLFLDDSIKVRLTSKSNRLDNPLSVYDDFDFPREARIHHRIASLLKYDLYLSPDIFLLAKRAKVKAHTFHGISIKGHAYSPKALAFERLFLIGPYQRRRFAELGITSEDDPRFLNVGMPKTDALLAPGFDRTEFCQQHELDPGRPIVVYAPTWRPEASLYTLGEEFFKAMPRAPWNFIIKLHDHSLDLKTSRIDWAKRISEIKSPNVCFYRKRDIVPALKAADLLVSDASSVANEFTLLDRPLVFIETPELFKKYGDTIDLTHWGQSTGPSVKDVPSLISAIEAQLANPTEYAERRRQIAHEGFYNPGKATDAAIRAIYEVLKMDAPKLDD